MFEEKPLASPGTAKKLRIFFKKIILVLNTTNILTATVFLSKVLSRYKTKINKVIRLDGQNRDKHGQKKDKPGQNRDK